MDFFDVFKGKGFVKLREKYLYCRIFINIYGNGFFCKCVYVFFNDNCIVINYIGDSLSENIIFKCFIRIYIRFTLL